MVDLKDFKMLRLNGCPEGKAVETGTHKYVLAYAARDCCKQRLFRKSRASYYVRVRGICSKEGVHVRRRLNTSSYILGLRHFSECDRFNRAPGLFGHKAIAPRVENEGFWVRARVNGPH